MKTIVQYARSIVILAVMLVVGKAVVAGLSIPVPGSVVGMILLAACLHYRIVVLPHVEPASGLLLRHMAFLFVPPGVGLILYFDLLREEWLALIVGSVVSTAAVLLVVALVQERMEAGD